MYNNHLPVQTWRDIWHVNLAVKFYEQNRENKTPRTSHATFDTE